MLWPKKQKKFAENQMTGLLALLPRDLVLYIMQCLSVYEQVGLGTVCKGFRDLLREHFHYDPFAPQYWMSLGNVDPPLMPAEDVVETLGRMAADAYGQICEFNRDNIACEGEGLRCELLVKLSQQATAPTGAPFIKVNCLAELKAGGKTVRAVNFTKYADKGAMEKLMGELQVDMEEVKYRLVTHRHAEMRLILKLTDQTSGSAELRIDKLCCVFCAAQLMALGYRHLIAGWAAGPLQWYTFSPITLFFTNRRAAIWGGAIEGEFMALSDDEKLLFLRLLVRQTQGAFSPVSAVASGGAGAMVVSGGPSGPGPRAMASSAPPCPKCGGAMSLRRNRSTGEQFWGCSRFPACNGTRRM